MTRALREPILDDGIRNPHYFEGRLLTAEALSADQEAHRTRQRRLGRALGSGVVEGLWVVVEADGRDGSPPVVAITGGLALNRNGQTLALGASREALALTRTLDPASTEPGLFRDCRPPSVGVEATGEGFYVLVLSPAAGYRDRAPANGLTTPRTGGGCGSRWVVEGVQLRLEPLDPTRLSGLSAATRARIATLAGASDLTSMTRLRSLLAHLCLGTEAWTRFAADPFAQVLQPDGTRRPASASYGALDDLRAAGRLTDCDVPLALLAWKLDGLSFVDNWAVRRRPAPLPPEIAWPTLGAERRRAEAEAALFQFQAQLADLLASPGNLATLAARDLFEWLPAAGMVPLTGSGRPVGFSLPNFFSGKVLRGPVFTEGDRLAALFDLALDHPPFATAGPELVWLYDVRQNRQAAGGAPVPPPFVVFAGPHLPFFGHPRFDVSRFGFSNYSSALV